MGEHDMPKKARVVIYTKEKPNPCPLSDADGHIHDGKGTATPIYHKDHIPEELRGDPVPGHKDHYEGGPK